MTARQKLYQAYCDHCDGCEQCGTRPTFESPRCPEGDKLFRAWWDELQGEFAL